jgi:DNA-binding response OmpR family regulator
MENDSVMDRRQPRIAVINDDTAFLDLMHELLAETEGYQVLLCKEGDQAYAFVKAHRPDLVILDIRIDHQENGWTILELLTLDPQTRPIPVIVCSAAITDLQAHQAVLDTLGIEVLAKPFDLDILLEKIYTALRRPPASGEAPA